MIADILATLAILIVSTMIVWVPPLVAWAERRMARRR